LYEQHRVHHIGGFPQLEDQMTTYVPGEADFSPDRMDALVWAISELMLKRQGKSGTSKKRTR
jgi:phage terminase large subunit-like protein